MKLKIPTILVRTITALFIGCFVFSCSNDSSKDVDNYLYRIGVGGKYGFMNSYGDIIIEPQFDFAMLFFSEEDLCYASILGPNPKAGLIDKTGSFVFILPDTLSFVPSRRNHTYAIIENNKKQGVIKIDGTMILPPMYENVEIFDEEENAYFIVKGGKYHKDCFIADMNGQAIFEPCDSILNGYSEGLCGVKIDGKWGYVGKDGTLTIEAVYDFADSFSDGLARVKKGMNEYYIDKDGNCSLVNCEKALSDFYCNRAFVERDGDKIMIDRKGNKICNISWDIVSAFSTEDSLAYVNKGDKSARIDTMGNVIVQGDYKIIGPFVNGLSRVTTKDGEKGFIDKRLNIFANCFKNGAWYGGGKLIILTDENVDSLSYYDLSGNMIWKDSPHIGYHFPEGKWERQDYMNYFDNFISDLDPIEGIYYVTINDYYQNRRDLNCIGQNSSSSKFYAVIRQGESYKAFLIDQPDIIWINKFVKIGDSNTYAIIKSDPESTYSSEGKVDIEDPSRFVFKLDRGHDDGYNYFVSYEFLRDYPPTKEYEEKHQAEWTGSGFAIANGYIVTNYHVINGAKSIHIRGIEGNMNTPYKAYVVASDKKNDLAILRIIDKNFKGIGFIPYKIGKSVVDVGNDVFVLGYPLISSMGEEIKLTNGIISSSSGYQGDETMYQITAAVQPGNSGGPVFNSEGTVIGIVCSKHIDAENVNYAIKISYLFSLLNESGIDMKIGGNNINNKRLSKKVNKIKDFVYLVECSGK